MAGRARGRGEQTRYARLGDLLDLAVALQGSLRGLAVVDVAERYGVSRRTAHRMLHGVLAALGPAAAEAETGPDRQKRWRARLPALTALVHWDAAELAALDAAAEGAARDGRDADARTLRQVQDKLRAGLRRDVAARLDPDLEALIEAQGFAMRPGPRPRTDAAVLDALRGAILACRRVALHHRREPGEPLRRQTVAPLGFLYGSRYYLVAAHSAELRPLLYRLSRIERVEMLDEPVAPPEGFSLRAFAANSFGVFQEDAVDVTWRFLPAAAAAAREYVFHPDQEVHDAPDGSLVVRFRAGGLLEMAWHLFTWGPDVEVLAPERVRTLLTERLAAALAHHARRPGEPPEVTAPAAPAARPPGGARPRGRARSAPK